MRRLIAITALSLASAAGGALPAAAGAAGPSCKSGKTVETSAYARILRWKGARYVCRRSSGRVEKVGLNCGSESPYDCYSLWVPRLSGRYLAYSIGAGWKCSRWEVVVEDLAAGTEKLRVLTGEDAPDVNDDRVECSMEHGVGPASDLVLTDSGAVGWIVGYYDTSKKLQSRVYKDTDSERVLLARRRDIDRKSLRLSDRVMKWTVKGRAYEARLD